MEDKYKLTWLKDGTATVQGESTLHKFKDIYTATIFKRMISGKKKAS